MKRSLTARLSAADRNPSDPHGLRSNAWAVVRKNKYDRILEVVAEGLSRDEAFRIAGLTS